MRQFMEGINSYVTSFQPLVHLLIAVVLVVLGVMFIVPSQKTKEAAKSALPWVIIGCGIVLGASSMASELAKSWTFGSGACIGALKQSLITGLMY